MVQRKRYFNELTELMILACLTKKSRYGYEIAEAINNNFDEKNKVSNITIYTSLYSLKDRNLIEERNVTVGEKRERVYYTLLPEGEEYFKESLKEYCACTKSVEMVLEDVTAFRYIKIPANITIND